MRNPLLLSALLASAVASAQRVDVHASWDAWTSGHWDGGSAIGTTYHVEMDEAQGGVNFQTAMADANYRTIKLRSAVTNSGPAHASATIRDTVRLDAQDHAGDWGVAYAWVRAHATTQVNAKDAWQYDYESSSGQASSRLSLSVGNNSFTWWQDQNAYEYWRQGDAAPEGETWNSTRIEMLNGMPDGSLSTTQPTAYGDSFYLPFYFRFGASLDLTVSASARCSLGGGGSALADFSDTYQWQGVDKVYALDASGGQTLLTDWSMVSGSGTDYVTPVPEPAPMLALAVGAVGLSRLRRRNRRS